LESLAPGKVRQDLANGQRPQATSCEVDFVKKFFDVMA